MVLGTVGPPTNLSLSGVDVGDGVLQERLIGAADLQRDDEFLGIRAEG